MENKKSKIIIFILLLLSVSIFLVLNISEFYKNKENRSFNNKTTINVEEHVNEEDIIKDKIVFKGETREIGVLEYVSHLGFNIRYQKNLFSISLLSNGSIKITNKDDENNYILIEKLHENEYYKAIKELNSKEYVKDNYLVSYKFFKGNVLTYLKLTKSINVNSQNYEEINANLDYIISSLVLTS